MSEIERLHASTAQWVRDRGWALSDEDVTIAVTRQWLASLAIRHCYRIGRAYRLTQGAVIALQRLDYWYPSEWAYNEIQ